MSKHEKTREAGRGYAIKNAAEKKDLHRIWLKDYAPGKRVGEFKDGKCHGMKAERVRW